MSEEVSVTLRLAEGMHFIGEDRAGRTIDLDSPSEGTGVAPSPMAAVLMTLAGCSGMDVVSIMRKKRQDLRRLEVIATGTRRDEYPRVYTAIRLDYRFTGSGLDPAACQRAIELSRDRYCPVWAMLRPTVDISYTFTINQP
ncbi:MAG: OsmC family protein [Chloroflexaceae bacterium]